MLAMELKKELIPPTKEEFDSLFKRVFDQFELYGQNLRIEGVEKYFNDIFVSKKFEEFNPQLAINSLIELWKFRTKDKDLLERIDNLETLYMTHASPFMQVFSKIMKLTSQNTLHFDELSLKEKAILKEGLISSEMKNYEKHIMRSIVTGNIIVLKALLEAGFDPNALCNGQYPIIEAAKNSNLEIAKLLLQFKANPNVVDQNSKAGIIWAFVKNNMEMFQLFLDNGAIVSPYAISLYEARKKKNLNRNESSTEVGT
jgi:ankyrin repeat protein